MTNDQVIAVEYADDMVYLKLADGRVIGNPLGWHPWLQAATEAQRSDIEFYELSVYWPSLDDGLDIEEMMKGLPPRLTNRKPTTA